MPGKRIPIQIPLGGVSEDRAFADQPGDTAQDAANMRATDCATGRQRLSVRPGTKRFNDSQVNGTHKIDHLASVTYAKSNQTLADPGNSLTLEWSKGNTVTGDTIGVQCGVQGDVISIDGSVGIMKRNRDGTLMWKITLAAVDKNHAVRALLVDSSTPAGLGSDFVLAGISSGGDSKTAKAWAYRQLNDNKVEKVWELSPQGYIEGFTITKDKLFLLCNFPDRNRAEIIAYDDYLTNSPTEVNRWLVPNSATSIDSGTQDGFIFTTHDANSDRDSLPGHPGATWPSSDWRTIVDLPGSPYRIWANLDASQLDTVALAPRDLAWPGNDPATDPTAPPPDELDGANVRAWIDASRQGRNFYQTAHKIPYLNGTAYDPSADPASRGAIYKKNGAPNGKACLHFDGLTCGMISEAPSTLDKANASANLSVIPSYKGASFVAITVCRASADMTSRVLLSQGYDASSNWGTGRSINIGMSPGEDPQTTKSSSTMESAGQISVYDKFAGGSDSGKNSTIAAQPAGRFGAPLGGGIPENGWCVITWVCDGGGQDSTTAATRSQFRVNGHPCDRWQSRLFSTLLPTTLGYLPSSAANTKTAGFVGDVAQILVLADWRDKDGVQQQLIGSGNDASQTYPDVAHQNSQDSFLERIEGDIAHYWGVARELPGGVARALSILAQPAAGDTFTIAGETYTFRSTTLQQTGDVAIGGNVRETCFNLWCAINAVGDPDSETYRTTAPNATYRALAPVQIAGTLGTDATSTWVDGTKTLTTPAGAGLFNGYTNGDVVRITITAGTNTVPGVYLATVGGPKFAVLDRSLQNATGAAGPITAVVPAFQTMTYAIMCRSRNAQRGTGGADFAKSGANLSVASANPAQTIDGAGGNLGWYPHPFFLERTPKTYGGPPRSAGAAVISKYWLLRSPYQILAAWDPASGKAKDVLTSGYDDDAPFNGAPTSSQGVGGLGYNVRAASSGAIYCCGQQQALVAAGSSWSTPQIDGNAYNVHRVLWANQAFALTGGNSWQVALASDFTYAFPRMAVDKYDNLFVPFSGSGSTSLLIFDDVGVAGNPTVISQYAGLADANEGYCVAVDPTYPDFTDFASLQRAEFCVLGTQQAGTSRNSLFRLHTLTVTQTAATPRATKLVAVSFGNIATITPSAITTKGTGATGFDSSASLVTSTLFQGNLYLTDGRKTKVYDPRADTLADHVATSSGGAPTGYALIETWNDSLVFARHRDNASQYVISAQGDPGNFDSTPYTVTQAQAIRGEDGSAGLPSDVINAFAGWFDDVALIGGERTIRRITGRPSPGSDGSIHLISPSIGIAFGKAWCISPQNVFYFFGSRGGVYFIVPGGGLLPLSSTQDKRGTRAKIERRLQNINLGTYRIEMQWSDEIKGIRLAVCPIGAGGTNVEHYFWEQATNAWWPDTYASSTIQPTCLAINDSDSPTDRVMIYGAEDGRIRRFDSTVEADDVILATGAPTYPINAKVRIGPLAPKETDFEALFSALEVILANDQDGAPWISIYVTDRADYLGPAVWTGQLQRGRNPMINFRRRGAFVFYEIASSDKFGRWAIEQLSHVIEAMGPKRMVPT